jgi:hypothetical protein
MVEEKAVRLYAHRKNIHRYRRLLRTQLTDLERRYLEQRMSEEQSNVDMLLASSFGAGLGHKLAVPAAD